MQNVATNIQNDRDPDLTFEILETTEATAMEEMGASSTVLASSSCCHPSTQPSAV